MKIEVISDIEQIKNEWEKLISQSETATFFQTYDWCRLWFNHFPVGEPYILALRDGELVALAPFIKMGKKLVFWGTEEVLGKELVTDYGDIICRKGKEGEIWQAILTHCQENKQSLDLRFLRESSPSFDFLKSRPGFTVEKEDAAPYLDLPASWEDYLLGLEKKKRHELKRKIRRLEETGAFKVWSGKPEVDLTHLFRLVKLSNDQKRDFLKPKMEDFFHDAIHLFNRKKMIDLCFLEFEGRRVAATLSLIYNGEVLLYNSGFDPDYSYFSPGFLLKVFLIKRAIEEGRKRFDFLRGGERYKYDLGAKDQNLYRIKL